MNKFALLIFLLLTTSQADTKSAQKPYLTTHEDVSSYLLYLEANGFTLQFEEKVYTFPFNAKEDLLLERLGRADDWYYLQDHLFYIYRKIGLAVILYAEDLTIQGVCINMQKNLLVTVHFYHDAIKESHGTVTLGEDLYQAQAEGKRFGAYRMTQATFRSHQHYLFLDGNDRDKLLARVVYSSKHLEPFFRVSERGDR
ncbi:hypothetical protein [Entomospira culicis]|uniref:Uncharacterized protein n=1 Tax=Entomospira culicis TaxID=2719989 RepID=A0A968KX96_9SPIO|nr:hypothetical protein [Entomospira culicis]NIZ19926.1 hypothetical protein [Entomospira culicis]NIZ70117.1 hypothetical protein [Entomospira culicis]WDI38044.1 hypothetical protein PVA46_07850 [Entomospira culicis]WDI39667.1 hypothetical protein PVA47_07850 [Entomospira culicis]